MVLVAPAKFDGPLLGLAVGELDEDVIGSVVLRLEGGFWKGDGILIFVENDFLLAADSWRLKGLGRLFSQGDEEFAGGVGEACDGDGGALGLASGEGFGKSLCLFGLQSGLQCQWGVLGDEGQDSGPGRHVGTDFEILGGFALVPLAIDELAIHQGAVELGVVGEELAISLCFGQFFLGISDLECELGDVDLFEFVRTLEIELGGRIGDAGIFHLILGFEHRAGEGGVKIAGIVANGSFDISLRIADGGLLTDEDDFLGFFGEVVLIIHLLELVQLFILIGEEVLGASHRVLAVVFASGEAHFEVILEVGFGIIEGALLIGERHFVAQLHLCELAFGNLKAELFGLKGHFKRLQGLVNFFGFEGDEWLSCADWGAMIRDRFDNETTPAIWIQLESLCFGWDEDSIELGADAEGSDFDRMFGRDVCGGKRESEGGESKQDFHKLIRDEEIKQNGRALRGERRLSNPRHGFLAKNSPKIVFHSGAMKWIYTLGLLAVGAHAEVALTIYNQNLAVVRDELEIELKKGDSVIHYDQATAQVIPDSVVLRDPSGQAEFLLREQSYRNDPISEGLLLSLFEGKEIPFERVYPDGRIQRILGKVIRSGYQRGGQKSSPVIETSEGLQFSLPGQPLFPSLGDNSILRPTLSWTLGAAVDSTFTAQLSYLTRGLSWEASYNLVAPEEGELVTLSGWITARNYSGTSFENAKLKLVAGDVNLNPQVATGSMSFRGDPFAGARQVEEKAFDDFYLYTLPRPLTIRDQETKQVEFLRSDKVTAKKVYYYDTSPFRFGGGRNVGRVEMEFPKDVAIYWTFVNQEENGLGVPLPGGTTRFYREDSDDGNLEFVGENRIDHTPNNERLTIFTGNAFDLVGERKITDFSYQEALNRITETMEVTLKNRSKKGQTIIAREHLWRASEWEVTTTSDFEKVDAHTIEFPVELAPDEVKTITYEVVYQW